MTKATPGVATGVATGVTTGVTTGAADRVDGAVADWPLPSRRRMLRAAAAGWLAAMAGTGLLLPRPGFAHHGFIGRHDFSRPMYLAGRVMRVYAGQPHARVTVRVPDSLQLPRDRERMRPLEDAEARQTLTLLTLLERRGNIELSVDRLLTRRLIDEPDLIREGDAIEAIVYRRTSADEYRNELHGVLLVLTDGRVLVSSSTAVSRGPSGYGKGSRSRQ